MLFAAMNASIKILGGSVPLTLVMTVRFLVGFWMVYPLVRRSGSTLDETLKTTKIYGHIARAAFGIIAVGCAFYILPLLPLGDANALGQFYPFFLLLLSVPILKESVKPKQYLACLLGFIGVILIATPHGQAGLYPALLAMLSAFAAAVSDIVVRYLARTDKSLTIVLWFFLLSGLAMFVIWMLTAKETQLSLGQAGYLLLAGLFGGAAQLALTTSFKHLSAGVMGPYSYLGFFFSIVLGWILFHEVPTLTMLGGALVIITAAQWNYAISKGPKKADIQVELT
jgi:drug/metabolite transporter (DMT)-like permease